MKTFQSIRGLSGIAAICAVWSGVLSVPGALAQSGFRCEVMQSAASEKVEKILKNAKEKKLNLIYLDIKSSEKIFTIGRIVKLDREDITRPTRDGLTEVWSYFVVNKKNLALATERFGIYIQSAVGSDQYASLGHMVPNCPYSGPKTVSFASLQENQQSIARVLDQPRAREIYHACREKLMAKAQDAARSALSSLGLSDVKAVDIITKGIEGKRIAATAENGLIGPQYWVSESLLMQVVVQSSGKSATYQIEFQIISHLGEILENGTRSWKSILAPTGSTLQNVGTVFPMRDFTGNNVATLDVLSGSECTEIVPLE